MTKTERRNSIIIIFLAWFAYLISYLGRTDYSSCLVEIIKQTGVEKATAGIVSSSFSLCNAIGQIASVFVIRKFSAEKVIAVEIFSLAIINFLFPMTDSFFIMAILWGINGAISSTCLCGITQIFALTLKEPYLSKGMVLLNTIGAVGGLLNYSLSYLLIRNFTWEAMFFAISATLFVYGIIWCIFVPKLMGENRSAAKRFSVDMKTEKSRERNASIFSILKSHGAYLAIMAAFFVGMLRESVTLWIPSFVNETFMISEDSSILITAVVPCLQICGAFIGGTLGRRASNLFTATFSVFVVSGVCLFSINLFGLTNLVLTLIFFVLNSICMTAALTLLLSLFPVRYIQRESLAMITGITNFSVHGGDFVSSWGIGFVTQHGGWVTVFNALGILAMFAAVICAIGRWVLVKNIGHKTETVL